MINRFIEWLKIEAKGAEVWRLIFVSVIAYGFTSNIAISILRIIGVQLANRPLNPQIIGWSLPFVIFFYAFREELMFRFPIYFVASMVGVNRFVLVYAFILSIGFGVAHGSWVNIFIQGFAGIYWSILYIKCGGGQGRVFKPLLASSFAHFAFNGILFLQVILSKTL